MNEKNLKDFVEEVDDSPEIESNVLQVYEIGFHILPTVPEDGLGDEVLSIKSAILENSGIIISEGFPVLKTLAYPMYKIVDSKKNSFEKAYFGWVKFETQKESILKIVKSIENIPSILRFITIKTVRENTIYIPKVSSVNNKESFNKRVEKDEVKNKKPASAEEIDKSIDELVIE